LDHYVPGDTVTEVLSLRSVRPLQRWSTASAKQPEEGIQAEGTISKQEAKLLIKHYEEGLSGYTYLEEAE
jgi:arginine decarboxylase